MKLILLILGLGLVLTLLIELVLRLGFGFGNPLLYQGDDRIGYLLQPNQQVKRFGNRIRVNAYHMRSDAVSPRPNPDQRRIFLIGDSIVNGGWWTDQRDTLSELLQGLLPSAAPQTQTEILNASANSWGPRNELAYLERFGTFGAETIVLVINTDDLFAVTPTAVPVGRDRNYPNHRPATALGEVFQRYLRRPKPDPVLEASRQEEGDRVARNLSAIVKIQAIAQAHHARFLLLLTPLKRELEIYGGPRDYELRERQRLVAMTQKQEMPFVDVLPVLNRAIAAGETSADALYRDHIHPSVQGNQLISQLIADQLSCCPDESRSSEYLREHAQHP